MDPYTKFVEDEVRDIPSDAWNRLENRLNTIRDNKELKDGIEKRLAQKSTSVAKQDLVIIVHMVIASYGYIINHDSVRRTNKATFVAIWEFLDTIRVSSSPSLSCTLHDLLQGRSKEGYTFQTNIRDRRSVSVNKGNESLGGNRWLPLPDDANMDFLTLNHVLMVDKLSILKRGVRASDLNNLF